MSKIKRQQWYILCSMVVTMVVSLFFFAQILTGSMPNPQDTLPTLIPFNPEITSTLTAQNPDPEITSTPLVDPEITSTPLVDPEIASTPSVDPEIASTSSVNPEITSTPSVNPEITSTPSVNPEITSTPSVNPEIVLTPTVQGADTVTSTDVPHMRSGKIEDDVTTRIRTEGNANVIVSLFSVDDFFSFPETERLIRIEENRNALLIELGLTSTDLTASYSAIPSIAMTITEQQLDILEASTLVDYVYIDRPIQAQVAEVRQHLGLNDASGVPLTSITGEGSTIAVLDSGIDSSYPIFNFGNDIVNATDETCFLANTSECITASGVISHGTTMAAIIKSIAPNARLVDIQVLSATSGTGFYSDWLSGLNYLLENHSALGITAVNASFSTQILYAGECESVYPDAANAVRQLREAGILVFSSTGNLANLGAVGAPACLSNTVGVGSIDISQSNIIVSSFTNRSNRLDFLASGEDIAVDLNGDGELYETGGGTSHSTAVLSGLVALLYEQNPELLPSQLLFSLRNGGQAVNVGILPDVNAQSHVAFAVNASGSLQIAEDINFSCASIVGISEVECTYLIDLYTVTGGPNGSWINDEGWGKSFTPCTDWHGVTCGPDDSVLILDLRRNGLTGVNDRPAAIPSGLTALHNLQQLFISGNRINGFANPDDIIALANQEAGGNLTQLDIGYNQFNPNELDSALRYTLTMLDANWRETQTYYPNGVIALTTSIMPPHIQVQWTPLELPNVTYDVRCQAADTSSNQLISLTPISGRIYEFDTVNQDTNYDCSVRARTASSDNNPFNLVSEFSISNDNSFAATTPDGFNNQQVTLTANDGSFVATGFPILTGNTGRGFIVFGTYDDPNDGTAIAYTNSVGFFDLPVFNSPLPVTSISSVRIDTCCVVVKGCDK